MSRSHRPSTRARRRGKEYFNAWGETTETRFTERQVRKELLIASVIEHDTGMTFDEVLNAIEWDDFVRLYRKFRREDWRTTGKSFLP